MDATRTFFKPIALRRALWTGAVPHSNENRWFTSLLKCLRADLNRWMSILSWTDQIRILCYRCHRSKTELEVNLLNTRGPRKWPTTIPESVFAFFTPNPAVYSIGVGVLSNPTGHHRPPPAEVRLAARRRWETWGFVGEAGGAASGIGWSSVKFSSNGTEARWRTAAGDGTVIATLEEGELVLLIACRFFCIVSLSLYC